MPGTCDPIPAYPPMLEPESAVHFVTEPTERSYGIEAVFRDNSGNWFSLTQRAA